MSKISKEELEAFWRGDKDTYQRMYSQRIQQKASEAERQGKQVTYVPNDVSGTLSEIVVTAPRETEEQKQIRLKQDYENFTDNALTAAGFIPGLDTAVDIADIANSWRKGDYSGLLWGLAGLGLPVSGKVLKSGWNWFKNLSSIGKNQGISGLVINNVTDSGKRLFSKTMPYDQTIVYNPNQIMLNKDRTPSLKQYGSYTTYEDGPFQLGYVTSGVKQIGIPTGNYHWREDITDINNPKLLDIRQDKHYIKNQVTPTIKEVTNSNDILQRIGLVPISNNSLQNVEKITVNPINRLVKVGQRMDSSLSPSKIVQFKYKPRLIDNRGRLVSSSASRYFTVPTKIEHQYTLWHKQGGKL